MPSNLGYLEADIDFGLRRFGFAGDCVGREIHFALRRRRFVMCFPNFDFAGRTYTDHPQPTFEGTRVRLRWLLKESFDETFGSERARQDDRVLRFVCNHLIVRTRGPVTSAAARIARADLAAWRDVFAKWFEVAEYLDLEGGSSIDDDRPVEGYFLYAEGKRKPRRIRRRDEIQHLTVSMMTTGTSVDRLRQILRLSSSGEFPPAYYVQIIAALKHFNQKRYRESILDSATAMEMAFVQLLGNRLARMAPEERNLILGRNQSIKNLSLALRQLGGTLPSQSEIQMKISEPRNRAIHRGIEVTHDQAKNALAFARAFIYTALPCVPS